MPVSEEDVEAIGKLYTALQERDVPALRKAFAHATYHVPGNNKVSGSYHGSDAIMGLFEKTMVLTDGTLSFELHDLVGGENHVVMLDRSRGTRKGRHLDQSRIVICHIEDGITTDVWLVVEDEYDFDEFWS